MPASARQAEKGSAALAVPASLPCSLLLLRLVEPAKELARLPHLLTGRIDWPSPDKSVASSAEFRERAPFLPRFRLSARSCKVPCSQLHPPGVRFTFPEPEKFHHIREGGETPFFERSLPYPSEPRPSLSATRQQPLTSQTQPTPG